MNREQFEQYCNDHGWKLDTHSNPIRETIFLRAYKHGALVIREFKVGMDLNDMLKEMKEEDYGEAGAQGEFPFAKAGELPM